MLSLKEYLLSCCRLGFVQGMGEEKTLSSPPHPFLPWTRSEPHDNVGSTIIAVCGVLGVVRITSRNFTKIAKAKKCGRECDQAAIVCLLWSLRGKTRDGVAQGASF